MFEECLLENNDVDDLLEKYKEQKREIYINDTLSARTKLGAIADAIADSCEAEYRANPTYKNEKNMRYWRYKAAQHLRRRGRLHLRQARRIRRIRVP